MSAELARVRALLHSPAAGPFASDLSVLNSENNVGGANIGMDLPLHVQRHFFYVTSKDFTGNIRQLAVGDDAAYDPGATGLFFNPGSVQVMGARSDDIVRLCIHTLCEMLRAHGYAPTILFVSIDNKVASGKLGCHLQLERLDNNLPGFSTVYNPSRFPGMICTFQDERRVMTVMLFENGKVMGLGIQDMFMANSIYLRLIAMAREFRADPATDTRRNKSSERVARQLNCNPTSGRGAAKRAKKVAQAVQEMMELNRARVGDTDFAREIKSLIDNIGTKRAHEVIDVEDY